jgi:thiopeptide-type bacteriocin biosynthesis protein
VPNDAPATDAWWQVNVEFPDPATAEHAGVHHLAPALKRAIGEWFLMRKKGAWRCRIHLSGTPAVQEAVRNRVGELLDELARTGHISAWTPVVYEAENRAFGGADAMAAAHTLFCADTHHLTRFLAAALGSDRRKEVSLLLCHILMRAADLDHFEQGDVWDRVAATRPLPAGAPLPNKTHRQVHRLLSVDPGPNAAQFSTGGAFDGFAPWARAFQACGQAVADFNTRGQLDRGLRGVIAHHIIFHWNRLGIPAPVQAVLSHAAATVFFDPEMVEL